MALNTMILRNNVEGKSQCHRESFFGVMFLFFGVKTSRPGLSVLCCALLPTDHSGLFQKHLLYVLRADRSLSCPPPLKQQGVSLRPLDAEIASFARDRSCRSSHLFPPLNLKGFAPSTPSATLSLRLHIDTLSAKKSMTMVDKSSLIF